MDDLQLPASPKIGYNKKKSSFPIIKEIPNVDIVKKKSKKKKKGGSSSPLPNYDSDLTKEENTIIKKRETTNSIKYKKNSFRNSQSKETTNTASIEPIININEFKNSKIKIVARLRPNNSFEEEMKENNLGFECVNIINNSTIVVNKNGDKKEFNFDMVLDSQTNQETLFNDVGQNMMKDYIDGFNVTLITYGHRNSGKSFTSIGDDLMEKKGFLPRAM